MNPIIADGGLTAITGIMTIPDQQSFIRTLPARSVYLAATDDTSGALLGIQDCLPDPDLPARCDISTFVSLNKQSALLSGKRTRVPGPSIVPSVLRKLKS